MVLTHSDVNADDSLRAGGLAWLRYRLDMAGMSGNKALNPTDANRNNPNKETISWELYKDYISGLTTGRYNK